MYQKNTCNTVPISKLELLKCTFKIRVMLLEC